MKRISMLVLSAALLGSAAWAKPPAQNVSSSKHPNLAAAQNLVAQAYQKIDAAQKANEWDMSGHAAKAKELLDQANAEIKQAAEAANAAHK
jgi:F0F1-type ATP synthase membrane subunit b/b'